VCLSPIDSFGDYLQECSHVPIIICRHDALVDVTCHALSQCHPGVLKEQRVSCEDHSHPGDVYHLDFQCGHPANFDLSVCGTIQPSYTSSCAGIATAAGELAKDLRHQDAVEEAGCDFIPLVVETFSEHNYNSCLTIGKSLSSPCS